MDSISIDFAQFGGKYYLVVADRSSGFTMAAQTQDQSTEIAVKFLKRLGCLYGFPLEVRSNGDPAFRGRFKEELM